MKQNLLEKDFVPLPLLDPKEFISSSLVLSLYHVHAYMFVVITVFGVVPLVGWLVVGWWVGGFVYLICSPHQSDFLAGRSYALIHLCVPHAQLRARVKTSI